MDGNQETSASEINTNTTIPQQDFDDDVDEVKANVECYSTMSQTTYDLIVSIPYHLSLKTICFMIFYGFFFGGGGDGFKIQDVKFHTTFLSIETYWWQ